MRASRFLPALIAFVAGSSALAGGSYEPVEVESIRINTGTNYELVVSPLKQQGSDGYVDPYMGHCSKFTVRGTFTTRRLPSFLTREAHLAALAHLESAKATGRPVNLGWMGTGFVPVQADRPCVVRSRALHLLEGSTPVVLSFHDAI